MTKKIDPMVSFTVPTLFLDALLVHQNYFGGMVGCQPGRNIFLEKVVYATHLPLKPRRDEKSFEMVEPRRLELLTS